MEFSTFTITAKGQALMAKLMLGSGVCDFTAIKTSSTVYAANQLAALTALTNIKQTAAVTRKTRINNTTVQIEGAIDNRTLAAGYNLNTIGIYAIDPDDGEILYAVAIALTAAYMPSYNGVTASGAYFKYLITVGNTAQVTVTVDPAGYASLGDVRRLDGDIANLQGYVGYNDADVYGVEVDYTNKTFTRLAGAVDRTPGEAFDEIGCFGGRRRCNLTNDGIVLAYSGDAGYTETGALTAAVTIGENEYPIGTIVQVMVEQPKFYYKVVPLVMDRITQGNGKGFHLRKARYYVSMTPKPGFKIHPAFIHNGVVDDVIYLSAYEGSIYDVSAEAYILDDDVTADFTNTTGDQLSSIGGAKPASGLVNALTRGATRKLAHNRGAGWEQQTVQTMAMTQLLFTVEYAFMNMQSSAKGLGAGVTNKTDDGATSMTELTGATVTLGDDSGSVTNGNGFNVVSYRGEENFFGNIWKWIDGINVFNGNGIGEVYIADHGFVNDTDAAPYKNAGISIAQANGYISAFGYNEEFDWLFIPSETLGNSTLPVGDYFYQNVLAVAGWTVCRLGGSWAYGGDAGGFCLAVNDSSGTRRRFLGGRLVYVPALAEEEAA